MNAVPTSAAPATTPLPRYLPTLDGIRGLAILLVLTHQFLMLEAHANLAEKLVMFSFGVGWVGVQLFFVLSGFLITGILLDTQRSAHPLRDFFVRRVLRIFPLYYAVLIVAFVVLPALGVLPASLQFDIPHQVWLWTYLSNWTAPFPDLASRTFPHFWSLALEEQFYLVWPFLLLGRTPRQVLWLGLSLALLSLASRVLMYEDDLPHGLVGTATYTFSICRIDALTLGGAMAAALRIPELSNRLRLHRQKLLLGAAALGVAGLFVTHGYTRVGEMEQTVGYAVLSVVFALFVCAGASADGVGRSSATSDPDADQAWWARVLRHPLLTTVGKYSYAMYVLHKPIHDFIGKPMLQRLGLNALGSAWVNVAYVAAGAVVTFAAGWLSYHVFERHFLALKDRLAPR